MILDLLIAIFMDVSGDFQHANGSIQMGLQQASWTSSFITVATENRTKKLNFGSVLEGKSPFISGKSKWVTLLYVGQIIVTFQCQKTMCVTQKALLTRIH